MKEILHVAYGEIISWRARLAELEEKKDAGASTLELVIISALIALAAVAVLALIVSVINGWAAKIPT